MSGVASDPFAKSLKPLPVHSSLRRRIRYAWQEPFFEDFACVYFGGEALSGRFLLELLLKRRWQIDC
jgi:hypothetical protein